MGNSESSTVLRNYVTALTEEECSESSTEFWENFFDMSLTAQVKLYLYKKTKVFGCLLF